MYSTHMQEDPSKFSLASTAWIEFE
jgi:hypothetical protein